MSNRKLTILALATTGAFAFGFSFALGLAGAGGPVGAGGNTKPAMGPTPAAQPASPEPVVVSDEAVQRIEPHPMRAAASDGNLVAGLHVQMKRTRKGD